MKRYRIVARFENEGLMLYTNGISGYFTDPTLALDMCSWLHTQYPHVDFSVK